LIVLDHVSVVFQYSLNIQRLPALVSIAQSLVSLLLTYFLVKQMGVSGALIASLLSAAFISFIFNPFFLIKTIRKNKARVIST
jgi:O-antigen/teichoic acid export membrane protein